MIEVSKKLKTRNRKFDKFANLKRFHFKEFVNLTKLQIS